MEKYVNGKFMRCGYTTGSCAQAAAQAAAELLFTGKSQESVSIVTANGTLLCIDIVNQELKAEGAECAVRKDSGDDPDVTNGALIYAYVKKLNAKSHHDIDGGLRKECKVVIDGGEGVGRVTLPGLDQPVGASAINHVPRQMIAETVKNVAAKYGYCGVLDVIISVPDGRKIAERTFNPKLGIVGGISILGTTGIVEPMSEKAIVDTIALELHMQREAGKDKVILTPGNFGKDFIRNSKYKYNVPVVTVSNFIGDALDLAAVEKYSEVLLVGHIGKLVKLAGGIMNTHSSYADCRTELFCCYAALNGASQDLCQKLMAAATTDECIRLLDEAGTGDKKTYFDGKDVNAYDTENTEQTSDLRKAVVRDILSAVQLHLDRRVQGAYRTGAVLFSNVYGFLGMTEGAEKITGSWKDCKTHYLS